MGEGVDNSNLKVEDADKGYTRYTKGKGVVVLSHKLTKVLRLSTSNQVVSHK